MIQFIITIILILLLISTIRENLRLKQEIEKFKWMNRELSEKLYQ